MPLVFYVHFKSTLRTFLYLTHSTHTLLNFRYVGIKENTGLAKYSHYLDRA